MIAQYYNFIRLGVEGYTSIINNDLQNARLLSRALENSEYYDVLSDMHRPKGVYFCDKDRMEKAKNLEEKDEKVEYNACLPVVSFRLTEEFRKENPHVKQAAVSGLLRTRGWIVPSMFNFFAILF